MKITPIPPYPVEGEEIMPQHPDRHSGLPVRLPAPMGRQSGGTQTGEGPGKGPDTDFRIGVLDRLCGYDDVFSYKEGIRENFLKERKG